MDIKIHNLATFFVVAASAVLLGAVGTARAADEWFVMGEQTLNATDPSAEIKTEGGPVEERRQTGKALCRGR
jgi:hypothetical protein